MLLIRPLIVYGCQNWYNMSAIQMEKLRVFERQCLRVCLNINRSIESNFRRYTSKGTVYKIANIPRIDSFILKLIRNHIKKSIKISHNEFISKLYHKDTNYYRRTMSSDYLPHETFIFLDHNEYLQDERNVPYFYHVKRRALIRELSYEPRAICSHLDLDIKYSLKLPDCDKIENLQKRKKIIYLVQRRLLE